MAVFWQKSGACRHHDGTEMESDSCQEGSGLPRSPHRKSQGATSVYCLAALPLYSPETRPATENIAGQTWHMISMRSKKTEKGRTFFALLWTHWYNDCVEIYVHVGGSVCVLVSFFFTPSVISFYNISSTLKACCLKSRLFQL